MANFGGLIQRYAFDPVSKKLTCLEVHLVVNQPHGGLRNLRRKVFHLDAVKLVYVHARLLKHLTGDAAKGLSGLQHPQLQATQLAVGDNQKITAAASRV